MANDSDIIADAKEAFRLAEDAESENRECALDDLRFARLGEQWPAEVEKQRERDGRPCLVINRMPAFIRQVVNDARQNKPSIKVHPVDSKADPETAEIYNGLIRNIEYTSNADVAYDTATECAVGMGFGYIRVDFDYAREDTFDQDIVIKRVSNPFSVYGDPMSQEADSSDWDTSFVVDTLAKKDFERQYPKAEMVDWGSSAWTELAGTSWYEGERVMLAQWWVREAYDKKVLMLSDGTVIAEDALAEHPELLVALQIGGLQVMKERTVACKRVKRHVLTGNEVLSTEDWPGQYIPIIPVYGDEVDVEGKRHFRSLIRDAKDAQRQLNYWRTTSTELVALAPRVPFIGPKGAFATDANKWATANRISHPYLEYDVVPGATGATPQRQPLDVGPAAGALQEALNASDDMKSIIGLYDASLGARSNETSGRAIMARQREGDVSTFHFLDNMARAIRHTGRVVIDLIPHIYGGARILRVLGEDGKERTTPVNQPAPVTGPDGQPEKDEQGNPLMRVYDLTAGKYDLTVSTGPSFTTRREEAAAQMTEFIRAFPAAAPIIGDLLAKNLDWPDADKVAERLQAMLPPQAKGDAGGLPPEIAGIVQQVQQAMEKLTKENEALKADRQVDMAKVSVDQFNAETKRAQVIGQIMKPDPQPPAPRPQAA